MPKHCLVILAEQKTKPQNQKPHKKRFRGVVAKPFALSLPGYTTGIPSSPLLPFIPGFLEFTPPPPTPCLPPRSVPPPQTNCWTPLLTRFLPFTGVFFCIVPARQCTECYFFGSLVFFLIVPLPISYKNRLAPQGSLGCPGFGLLARPSPFLHPNPPPPDGPPLSRTFMLSPATDWLVVPLIVPSVFVFTFTSTSSCHFCPPPSFLLGSNDIFFLRVLFNCRTFSASRLKHPPCRKPDPRKIQPLLPGGPFEASWVLCSPAPPPPKFCPSPIFPLLGPLRSFFQWRLQNLEGGFGVFLPICSIFKGVIGSLLFSFPYSTSFFFR